MKLAPVALVCAILTCFAARAQTAFVEMEFARAAELTQREQRPLLVCFHVPWSLACRHMAETTWAHPPLVEWQAKEFISIRVDAAEHRSLAERFRIDRTPAVLILTPDGRERDCILGYRDGRQMLAELRDSVAGRDAESRARPLVERGGPASAPARHRLAAILARSGREAEALEHLVWCYDEGLSINMVYAAAQRRMLVGDFAALARRHPPAADALAERRARAERALRAGDNSSEARNLALITRETGDAARLLTLFDALPPSAASRTLLVDAVFDELIRAGRYADLLRELKPTPVEHYRQQVQMARTGGGMACCSIHAPRGPAAAGGLMDRGAALLEALAAENRRDDARAVIASALSFEDNPQVRALLAAGTKRGGQPDWEQDVAREGGAKKPGAEEQPGPAQAPGGAKQAEGAPGE
ncbi:MAG: thioredoxin family protein [Planctomycetia bacterium]|nr:MAG: thioredoxin family protein [Planctomycetia bacterium]